jgi:hypothetical protein
MKRRWKIITVALILIFVLPLIGHVVLSNPTSLPLEKGDRIYVGATTVLGIFTFPFNDPHDDFISISFVVYENSTLRGAWVSSEPTAVYLNTTAGLNIVVDKSGVLNWPLDPGYYALVFAPSGKYFNWYNTVTITHSIQLIPDCGSSG